MTVQGQWGQGQEGCGDHGNREDIGTVGTGMRDEGQGRVTGSRVLRWQFSWNTAQGWGGPGLDDTRFRWLRVGTGHVPVSLPAAIRIKKPIKTKFRLPVFNWTALKPSQISGTVFSELDDERVLEVSPGPLPTWAPPTPTSDPPRPPRTWTWSALRSCSRPKRRARHWTWCVPRARRRRKWPPR